MFKLFKIVSISAFLIIFFNTSILVMFDISLVDFATVLEGLTVGALMIASLSDIIFTDGTGAILLALGITYMVMNVWLILFNLILKITD